MIKGLFSQIFSSNESVNLNMSDLDIALELVRNGDLEKLKIIMNKFTINFDPKRIHEPSIILNEAIINNKNHIISWFMEDENKSRICLIASIKNDYKKIYEHMFENYNDIFIKESKYIRSLNIATEYNNINYFMWFFFNVDNHSGHYSNMLYDNVRENKNLEMLKILYECGFNNCDSDTFIDAIQKKDYIFAEHLIKYGMVTFDYNLLNNFRYIYSADNIRKFFGIEDKMFDKYFEDILGSSIIDNEYTRKQRERRIYNEINSMTSKYISKDGEEKNCPICLEDFVNNGHYPKFTCGHMLHRECAVEYLIEYKNIKCILCRQKQENIE